MRVRAWARHIVLSTIGPFASVNPGTYFLNGHYVCKDQRPIEIQQEIFADLIKELSKNFDIVSPEEAISNLNQRSSKCLCLTFDDGFRDNYTVIAPVAEYFQFRCLFFVTPLYLGLEKSEIRNILLEKYKVNFEKVFLNKAEVRNLAKNGHTIGSHGFSHTRLNITNISMLETELIKSKSSIETITNKSCDLFAYPFGKLSDLSLEGLELACSTYKAVFSSTSSPKQYEFSGRVINRRHFEGNWPASHVNYFLSRRK
jgi:peptidoglycan/xylan/chitin deacetylase (PgdA/CDA1 family)